MRDVLIQNATNGAVQIALLDTNETPANISLEEGRSFYQVSFNTSTNKIENLLNNIGFSVQTLSRQNLAHGIDPEGISKGMDFLKSLK